MKKLVFVYGTLKQGYGNWMRLLKDQEFMGRGITSRPFFMRDTGGFPVVVSSDVGTAAPVSGEVYNVTEEGMKGLDHLENEGVMYKREPVTVTVEGWGDLDCEIYVGVPSFWEGYLQTLVPVQPNEDNHLEWNR